MPVKAFLWYQPWLCLSENMSGRSSIGRIVTRNPACSVIGIIRPTDKVYDPRFAVSIYEPERWYHGPICWDHDVKLYFETGWGQLRGFLGTEHTGLGKLVHNSFRGIARLVKMGLPTHYLLALHLRVPVRPWYKGLGLELDAWHWRVLHEASETLSAWGASEKIYLILVGLSSLPLDKLGSVTSSWDGAEPDDQRKVAIIIASSFGRAV